MSILTVDRAGMRKHSENLGIKGDLYGLFACMVTGRPWESVMAGITNRKQDAKEVISRIILFSCFCILKIVYHYLF